MTGIEVGIFALEAIAKIVRAAFDAHEGKITPEEALKRMSAATARDAVTDAAANTAADAADAAGDAAIDAKFPKTSEDDDQ